MYIYLNKNIYIYIATSVHLAPLLFPMTIKLPA